MQTLVLYGSGEFTNKTDEIDDFLITEKNIKKIAIIPTAAGKEKSVGRWFEMANEHYSKFGTKIINIDAFNKTDANNKDIVDKVKDADLIFLSGGDPAYLLESIKNTLLWQNIYSLYENEIVLCGSSAGAMIMGNYLISNPQSFFLGSPKIEEGFSLIKKIVIPHFNMVTRFTKNIAKDIQKIPEDFSKDIFGIDEDTAVIIESKEGYVLGHGSAFLIKTTGTNKYPSKSTIQDLF